MSCAQVSQVTESKKLALTETSRRYPELKSAIIKYKVSGMNTGTEVVYIDDWGRREAIYKKMITKMMGVDLERNYMTLITDNGKWIYNIDLNSGIAIKMDETGYKSLAGNTGRNMDDTIGATKIGTEEIVGRVCDVWKKGYPYSMAWIWKGVALKKDQDVAAMGVLTEATDIQENVHIPDEKFTIPPGVKVKVLDARALSGG
jgi:outer membrane lipoprotein-sorting protein